MIVNLAVHQSRLLKLPAPTTDVVFSAFLLYKTGSVDVVNGVESANVRRDVFTGTLRVHSSELRGGMICRALELEPWQARDR
jgi:hypothetical protein